MSKRVILSLVVLVVLVGGLVAACAKPAPAPAPTPAPAPAPAPAPSPEPEGPVVVACLSYLTGMGWDQGKGEFWGMHMAIDEINQAGGVLGRQVEYVDIDLGFTNDAVISAFKRAAAINPAAIVGGQEAGGQDAAAATQRELGILQCVLYACSGKLVQPGYFYGGFHVNMYPEQFHSPLVELCEERGYKKVAIVQDDSGYGQGSAQKTQAMLEAAGIEVVAVEFFTWTEMYEIGSQVRKALSFNPDVLRVQTGESGAVSMAKIIKEVGWKGQVCFDCGTLNDAVAAAVAKAGESAEGWQGVRTWYPDPDVPASIEFNNKFQAYPPAGGMQAWDYAVGGYIGMRSMLEAMNIAGTTTDRLLIADAVYANDWMTPYGAPALWLPGGQFAAPWTGFGKIENGKIVKGAKKILTPADFNEPYPWYDAYQKGMDAYKEEFRK